MNRKTPLGFESHHRGEGERGGKVLITAAPLFTFHPVNMGSAELSDVSRLNTMIFHRLGSPVADCIFQGAAGK